MVAPGRGYVNRNEYETSGKFGTGHRIPGCGISHKRYSCPRDRF
jgi:hypothetical protein